jgi:uncharacterized membrane protein (Fun14 family)
MEVVAEILLTLFQIAGELRPKQAFILIALVVMGLFGLYLYGCLEVNTKQLSQYNEIVATAIQENYKATSQKAMQISSDNKITRLEFSNLKILYERDLKYAKKA